MLQTLIHYGFHLLVPLGIALLVDRAHWKTAYLILLATMLVDLDHLLAEPLFQADRCSIAFHPLHSYYAMGVYVMLLFFRNPFRLIGIGLLWHMATDLIDCLFMYHRCASCQEGAPAYELMKWMGGG